jgi:hypothetical protein
MAFTKAAATQCNVLVITTNFNLIASCDGFAFLVHAEIHGGFSSARANGFDFAKFVSPSK